LRFPHFRNPALGFVIRALALAVLAALLARLIYSCGCFGALHNGDASFDLDPFLAHNEGGASDV
jgi:hypothetical protein